MTVAMVAGSVRATTLRPAECEMAQVQLDFATQVLHEAGSEAHVRSGTWRDLMTASLNSSGGCTFEAEAEARPVAPAAAASPFGGPPATEVFVSPTGSDRSGDGTIAHPFASLQRGLDAASYGPAPRAVWLRGGDFHAPASVALATPRNSDTTVATWPQDAEQATLWGGAPLPGLVWTEVGNVSGGSIPVLSAPLDAATGGPAVAALLLSAAGAASVSRRPAPIPALLLAGRRMVRARFPNADPETDRFPNGYFTGPMTWRREGPSGAAAEVVVSSPSRPASQWPGFSMFRGGALERFEGSGGSSFWSSAPPATVNVTAPGQGWTPREWGGVEGAVASTIHGAGWGGWQFGLASAERDGGGTLLRFGRGGFQESRAWGSGDGLFVENVAAELDAPGEWAVVPDPAGDAGRGTLLLAPWTAGQDPRCGAEVLAATATTVLRVQGSAVGSAGDGGGAGWDRSGRSLVRGFALVNVTVGATASTYMHAYEGSMSGGDWSVFRGAAVVLDAVAGCRVDLCTFERPGGNGLLVSGRSVGTAVTRTEFSRCGDSAVVVAGRASLLDAGSVPDVPVNTTVDGCFVHDTGVYGKQTAAVASILAVRTAVRRTVAFEGPRQGVVFMDGLGGGHVVERCSMWRQMLETQDGGVVYQWDRAALLASPLDLFGEAGTPASLAYLGPIVRQSLLRCDAGCVWPVDWDDGSRGWTMEGVVSVYGGAKNFEGHNKTVTGSLFVYVDHAATNGFCLLSDGADAGVSGYGERFTNNTCITGDKYLFQFGNCEASSPLASPITLTGNNRFLVAGGNGTVCCGHCGKPASTDWTLEQFAAATGSGKGSTVSGDVPPPAGIAAEARALLSMT